MRIFCELLEPVEMHLNILFYLKISPESGVTFYKRSSTSTRRLTNLWWKSGPPRFYLYKDSLHISTLPFCTLQSSSFIRSSPSSPSLVVCSRCFLVLLTFEVSFVVKWIKSAGSGAKLHEFISSFHLIVWAIKLLHLWFLTSKMGEIIVPNFIGF